MNKQWFENELKPCFSVLGQSTANFCYSFSRSILYLPTPCQYEFTITTASGCNFSRNPFSIVQCPDNGESLITQTFDHYSLFAGGLSNNAKRIRSGAISKQQKTCLTTEGKEKSTSRSFWFWLLSACSKVLLLQWTRIWPCRLCQTWSSIWQLHWVIIL